MHDEDEEEHQRRCLPFVSRNAQHQQRRDVAHEVDADHQRPLVGGAALEKPIGVAGQRGADREEDRHVDGDQDAEQAVPCIQIR